MQHTIKLCSYCGAPLIRGSPICRACDRPVAQRQSLFQAQSGDSDTHPTVIPNHSLKIVTEDPDDPLSYKRPLRNPYWAALYVGWGLIGLTLALFLSVSAMTLAGIWSPAALLAASIPWIFFCLIQISVWVLGLRKLGQIRAFLASSRPVVRWVYTLAEWRVIQAENWEESKGDWKIQLGCLTFLFGIAGLLSGLFIGLEEGLGESILGALMGMAGGVGAGSLIGGVVAGGNHLVARLMQQDLPTEVALTPTEFYYSDDYFKANGITHRVEGAELQPGDPAILVIKTWSQKVRGSGNTTWTIPVPERCLPQVRALLPHFPSNADVDES